MELGQGTSISVLSQGTREGESQSLMWSLISRRVPLRVVRDRDAARLLRERNVLSTLRAGCQFRPWMCLSLFMSGSLQSEIECHIRAPSIVRHAHCRETVSQALNRENPAQAFVSIRPVVLGLLVCETGEECGFPELYYRCSTFEPAKFPLLSRLMTLPFDDFALGAYSDSIVVVNCRCQARGSVPAGGPGEGDGMPGGRSRSHRWGP